MSYDNLFWGDVDTPNHSQWRIKAEDILADRDIFHPTANKHFPLGAIADARDGRRWRYCEKDGTNALVKAILIGGDGGTAGWQTEIQTNNPSIPALGDKAITITMTATASAHDFIDGYLSIETGTGIGDMYLVKDNKAGVTNSSGGYDIALDIADAGGIRTALSVSDTEITLTKNKYKDVLLTGANVVAVVIGVPLVAVPVDYFFWAQTRGWCPIIADSSETIIVGDWLMASEVTPGAVDVLDGAVEDNFVGVAMAALTATVAETVLVDLRLE